MDKFLINLRTHPLWPNRKIEYQSLFVGALVILYVSGIVDQEGLLAALALLGTPIVGWATPEADVHVHHSEDILEQERANRAPNKTKLPE